MGNSLYCSGVTCLFHESWSLTDTYQLLPMGADPKYTMLTGFSSGGFFSSDLQVIYSETFKGMGAADAGLYAMKNA